MKPKIYLLGQHAKRTPFAYDIYKPLFSNHYDYVESIDEANLIILGFTADIWQNVDLLTNRMRKDPFVKIVVLSEEPFWDVLWGGDIFHKKQSRVYGNKKIDFLYLNHFNSNIFNFKKIPYFITTSNDYIVRYKSLFNNNSCLTIDDIKQIWNDAYFNFSFIAEKREGDKYKANFDSNEIWCLCNLRTELALNYSKTERCLVEGKGWLDKNFARQNIPDWHLDKLAKLYKNSRIVSAIENVHQINYISEKIFDAYACLGIPLYYATNSHYIWRLFPRDSFINLKITPNNNIHNLANILLKDGRFIQNFINVQKKLKDMFEDDSILFYERYDLVEKINFEIH